MPAPENPMTDEPQAYWRPYYEGVHERAQPWLDYSNDRVQAQTFAVALEAGGPLSGREVLDAGAGHGAFARALSALGARVTAIEFVASSVERLAREAPGVAWRAGDVAAEESYAGLPPFDVVFALEVLQYVPFPTTIALLLERLTPGGRLVGVIPNADCPFVKKANARFDGRYKAVRADEIRAALGGPRVARWAHRALRFGDDQSIVPYDVSPFGESTRTDAPPPNRWLFVAVAA